MRNGLLLGGLAAVLAVSALVISVIALISPPGAPDEYGDDYEFRQSDRGKSTVDLVQQALRRYDEKGREATLDYYNSPESVEGERYVFIVDEDDRVITHRSPDLLGQDLKGDLGVDVTGYRFGEVMLGVGEQGLWVDYLFLNPATGNQEFKHSWVVRHDGLLFGSGWYQVLPSSPLGVTKADPAEYTVAVVDRAVRYYKAHGRAGAVQYYNAPESVDGNWYVLVVDENNELLAHRDPSLPGKHIDELGNTVDGRQFTELEVTEVGRWVDYVFLNPATGTEGIKHSWVVRHDGLVIGSGWYE